MANNQFINVKIDEVLAYLLDPSSFKSSYFTGHRYAGYHSYGAEGDVMAFKKGSNNAIIGYVEYGNNNEEMFTRLYLRFELIP